jgi:hypothetical protein
MLRTEIINLLALKMNAQSYAEIGLEGGTNFARIQIPNRVSIDPAPNWNATYKLTSDDFFKTISKDQKYDIIFIDGLHLSQQVIKDVNNSLDHVNDGGVVIMHDCNPPTELHQDVEDYDITDPEHWPNGPKKKNFGFQRAWNGDVWRAFAHFRITRSDLSMFTVDTDWGVGIVMKGQQETLKAPLDIKYPEFALRISEVLNLVSTDQFIDILLYQL